MPRSLPSSFQFPQPLSRFTTLFTDEFGTVDATRILKDRYIASVDPKHKSHSTAKQMLGLICEVVNSLLPGGVQLNSVTSERVQFKTAQGAELSEKELSDGYRIFLSVLDLLRHFSNQLGSSFAEVGEKTNTTNT